MPRERVTTTSEMEVQVDLILRMLTRKSKGFSCGGGPDSRRSGTIVGRSVVQCRARRSRRVGGDAGFPRLRFDPTPEACIDESRVDLDGEWAADDLDVPGGAGAGAGAADGPGAAAGHEGPGHEGQAGRRAEGEGPGEEG